MSAGFKKVFPQPIVAALLTGLALLGLGGAWLSPEQGGAQLNAGYALLAIFFGLSVVFAYLFSIHLGKNLKVEMTTVPLYLMAVLIPSIPLAATTAALGVLTAELIVRARRQNQYPDVLTAASRTALMVLGAATVAHLDGLDPVPALLGAAFALWALDTLTIPLVVAPMTGERPFKVLAALPLEAVLVEGAQYLLGLLGALAANVQVWAMFLLVPPTVLVYLAFKRAKDMETGARLMLERMADAVDMRDPYTGGHSRRVADLCAAMLEELGMQGPEAELIVSVARIHDIGKIGIPDAVLRKCEALTEEEWTLMQSHAEQGAELLGRYPDFAGGISIVRHHHEKWDGTGYPHRLRGTEIPFGARVIAVADSFDAMTTDRPYRRGVPVERAATILRDGRGRQWDPALVDALLRTIDQHPQRRPAPRMHLVPVVEQERSA